VPFFFQAGLLLSPVAYPLSETHGVLRTLLEANPLTGIIEAWRWSMLGSDASPAAFVFALAWTVVLLVAGWRIFARAEVAFSDVI
jgi:lipopolysaccharide transport system permease protein